MFDRCWPFTSHQSRVTGHARIGAHALALLAAISLLVAITAQAAPREREPNSSYAERRAKVRAQADAPVVIFGYTGREDASPAYVFQQEHYFYYLTGHNEEGAALVLHPEAPDSPREILYLPERNPQAERWNGVRLGPDDAGVQERTGFATVKPFSALRGDLEALAKQGSTFYALLPVENAAGYPHRENWLEWLKQAAPSAQFLDVTTTIATMRQIKSPSEIKLLTKAIEASIDAHLEAMRMMRPGLWEYEVAAKMEYVHKAAGCEAEGYAPIVGSGFNSTVLHYAHPVNQVKDGDVVVLDVGGQYSGYVADITRTLPANGKFTPRQREIYEVVLGAQNAVLAALKPGMSMGGRGENSLVRIATEYMNAHGKDKNGEALGKYFIHGLGHHIGLYVHDVGPPRPLEPGMVVTIEPGIYIPEENLGVRIEDIVLITETGYKLLTQRLPRTADAVEKVMGAAAKRKK
ncbi:MAG: aminopeptidase P N-terminal domain-containing protein [Candidatus Acidiferrales bacterium]